MVQSNTTSKAASNKNSPSVRPRRGGKRAQFGFFLFASLTWAAIFAIGYLLFSSRDREVSIVPATPNDSATLVAEVTKSIPIEEKKESPAPTTPSIYNQQAERIEALQREIAQLNHQLRLAKLRAFQGNESPQLQQQLEQLRVELKGEERLNNQLAATVRQLEQALAIEKERSPSPFSLIAKEKECTQEGIIPLDPSVVTMLGKQQSALAATEPVISKIEDQERRNQQILNSYEREFLTLSDYCTFLHNRSHQNETQLSSQLQQEKATVEKLAATNEKAIQALEKERSLLQLQEAKLQHMKTLIATNKASLFQLKKDKIAKLGAQGSEDPKRKNLESKIEKQYISELNSLLLQEQLIDQMIALLHSKSS